MKEMDIREKISTMWIVVMFTMVFNDIIGFITPGALKQILESDLGFELTPIILLVFSILLVIPIVMIFFTRILKRKANRKANIAVSIVTILYVIFGGEPSLTYIFFASVEVIFMLLILRIAIKWPEEEV